MASPLLDGWILNCKLGRPIIRYTENDNHFEGVLYQYFEGLNYERYHRSITISITILIVRGEREKKNNKTDISRARSKRKEKKIWICERRLFHLFQKIIFFGVEWVDKGLFLKLQLYFR
jgi:hypothetical protein